MVDRSGCGEYDILPAKTPLRGSTPRAIACVAPPSRRGYVPPHGMWDRARTTAGTTRLQLPQYGALCRRFGQVGVDLSEEKDHALQASPEKPNYDGKIKRLPAVRPMGLTHCLHIVFGRLRRQPQMMGRRFKPFVVCFQRPKRRLCGCVRNGRPPRLRWRKFLFAIPRKAKLILGGPRFGLQSSWHGAR